MVYDYICHLLLYYKLSPKMAAKKKKQPQPYYLTISDVKNLDATYLSPLAQGFS